MTKWATGLSGLVLMAMTNSVNSSPAITTSEFTEETLWVAARGSIGRDEAAATARSATGGRVLSVDPQQRRGRTIYRVKVLLKGGRVRVLNIDGQTGELLN